MSTTLYAKYLKERESAELLEKDWGFATYKLGPDYVYLQDIYVDESERQSGKGVELMNEVAEIARAKGIKTLLGSVDTGAPFATTMMTIMIKQGFKLMSCSGNLIYLKKDI